jgi:hypothetical protein
MPTAGINREGTTTPNLPRSTIAKIKTGRAIRYNHRLSIAEESHVGPSLRGSVTALTVAPRRHSQLAEISPNANGAAIPITGITHSGTVESALGANIGMTIMAMTPTGKTIISHFMLKTKNN